MVHRGGWALEEMEVEPGPWSPSMRTNICFSPFALGKAILLLVFIGIGRPPELDRYIILGTDSEGGKIGRKEVEQSE
jgi:hypothetical protein